MAITKTDARVENMREASGIIMASVNHAISDDSTDPATEVTRVRAEVVISNATSAELTAIQSLATKAVALAIA